MRRRLVFAFVGLAVGIIALFGIPRTFMIADLVHSIEQRNVTRLAGLLAVTLASHADEGEVTEEFLAPLLRDGEQITIVTPDGDVIEAGDQLRSAGDLSATTELDGGGSLTFTRSEAVVTGRVREAVVPALMMGLSVLVISAAVALLLARRLSRPFVRLAAMAEAMGDGALDPDPQDLRIPEARAIATALHASADTLETRIRREHEFAANASHQLRTPITALRLELEDLSLWKETPQAVADQLQHALHEIDRLSDAVAQLLELARGGTPGADTALPLAPMLVQAAQRWQTQAASLGRAIRVRATDLDSATAPAPAGQIFDVLLHNALMHGRGEVAIDVVRAKGYLTVRVADEGPRPKDNAIFQRTPGRSSGDGEGIGLALSAELAEALGGHLLLDSAPTTTFSLMLPQRSGWAADGGSMHDDAASTSRLSHQKQNTSA